MSEFRVEFNGVDLTEFVRSIELATGTMSEFSNAVSQFADAAARGFDDPDETHGSTLDELIPEIDAFLAEYRGATDG